MITKRILCCAMLLAVPVVQAKEGEVLNDEVSAHLGVSWRELVMGIASHMEETNKALVHKLKKQVKDTCKAGEVKIEAMIEDGKRKSEKQREEEKKKVDEILSSLQASYKLEELQRNTNSATADTLRESNFKRKMFRYDCTMQEVVSLDPSVRYQLSRHKDVVEKVQQLENKEWYLLYGRDIALGVASLASAAISGYSGADYLSDKALKAAPWSVIAVGSVISGWMTYSNYNNDLKGAQKKKSAIEQELEKLGVSNVDLGAEEINFVVKSTDSTRDTEESNN